MMLQPNQIILGCAFNVLRTLPVESIQMCVTSPPYWQFRDYSVPGQLGLESSPDEYISKMVGVFREVRRVLRKDGLLWVNIGDSYNAAGRDGHGTRQGYKQQTNRASSSGADHCRPSWDLIKPKDLVGIPWMLAFALRDDGWYLRQDIIWEKGNCMPESVKDRCTKSHEYIFLLSKSKRYYFDSDAIKEPASSDTHARYARGRSGCHKWADGGPGNQTIAKSFAHMLGPWRDSESGQDRRSRKDRLPGVTPKSQPAGSGVKANESFHSSVKDVVENRNKRSVWRINSVGFSEAHFATFPKALVEPCILAGSRVGDVVLDPFMGAGTTAIVAQYFGRRWVGIEINPDYVAIAERRIKQECAQLNMFC